MKKKMKIAVVGSGISGLSSAWLISKKYDVCLFEKNDYLGGHSNTQTIITNCEKKKINVDTGFIVFNEQNYPNLKEFFKLLEVDTYESNMSFSVSMFNKKFEYGGENINSLFAQRKNIISLNFWIMIFDLVRFYNNASIDMFKFQNISVGEYLSKKKYSKTFIYKHLYPMAASIWSSNVNEIENFPFPFFIRFFKNHGLLSLRERPKWRTVKNGSKSYVKKILEKSKIKIHKSEAVINISRANRRVHLQTNKNKYIFDHVVLASHPDESLKLLNDPSKDEQTSLSKIKYQKNTVYLHSDNKFMPKNRKVWSSWNYIDFNEKPNQDLCVTYWMNNLQNLNTGDEIFVSLNLPELPDKNKIFKTIHYSHPLYLCDTISGQKGLSKIQGHNNTWYCGAYCGMGFHEDGIKSGLTIAEKITDTKRPWIK
ncbi:NAD(P)-binding protein [Rickettsiales bacterium]|nr:NAD(P)-binding protein [Rickettsiales bacterium]